MIVLELHLQRQMLSCRAQLGVGVGQGTWFESIFRTRKYCTYLKHSELFFSLFHFFILFSLKHAICELLYGDAIFHTQSGGGYR
jgi:hypothetical protein